jgi:hypothetical protein
VGETLSEDISREQAIANIGARNIVLCTMTSRLSWLGK